MPIKFAVKTVRLKVYIIGSQSDDLVLHPRSQLRLKLETSLTCTITAILCWTVFMAYLLMLILMTLTLIQGKGKHSVLYVEN